MCADVEENLELRPSRGLEWDIDQPIVKYGSIGAAIVALIALLLFFPDHEKSSLSFIYLNN